MHAALFESWLACCDFHLGALILSCHQALGYLQDIRKITRLVLSRESPNVFFLRFCEDAPVIHGLKLKCYNIGTSTG